MRIVRTGGGNARSEFARRARRSHRLHCTPANAARADFDVAVIGGGLAGLTAARRLDARRLSVVVLEANPSVGGRMASIDVGGTRIDVGGQWAGPTQDRILALAKSLGVRHFDSYHKGATTLVWKGERSTFEGDFPPFEGDPPKVSRAELRDAVRLWDEIEGIADHDIGSPWTYSRSDRRDDVRLDRWLRDKATTDFGPFVVKMMAGIGGSGAFEPRDVSVLHMGWTQATGPQREHPEAYLFDGTAGQIPPLVVKAFSTRVRVRCNAPVQHIEQSADGVTVTARGFTCTARRAIVAVPPTSLRDITFRPDVDPRRRALLRRAHMGAVIKVHAVYATPFWRTRRPPVNGSATGDLPTVQFVVDSSPRAGTPGVLTSFITGRLAERLSAATPAARKRAVLKDYVTFFGPEAGRPRHFVEKDWLKHPYIGGAFTWYLLPNTWARFGAMLRPPHGLVHWAGTEVADRWSGYFDGAVRSGECAASAVIDALNGRAGGRLR
ncbi:MAG TPA: FAD-dependent oxidoreductase [Acidimicrobiales bacterium]|nr:FAD-dependent oxidoreductase [Acidimicrobiales bacterium]